MSHPTRLTLLDVRARQAAVVIDQDRRNAAAIRRVAARLPACVIAPRHCPVHNSREAAAPGRATASTTTTRSGGPSGCTSQ